MQAQVTLPAYQVPSHLRKYFQPKTCGACYVCHLVAIFREVKRVLRSDGTCWINLGSSYASQGGYRDYGSYDGGTGRKYNSGMRPAGNGFKVKDLIPIPWMVAMALQADGWYLRSAPPWIKPNCMPESVTDRATTAHEYWFQLTKSNRYYYDAEAVRGEQRASSAARYEYSFATPKHYARAKIKAQNMAWNDGERAINPSGRNRRTSDFWNESLAATIEFYRGYVAHLEHVREHGGMLLNTRDEPLGLMFPTKGFKGAHFATFNTDLITPLVLCSTSARGVCPECGGQWERVVEKTGEIDPSGKGSRFDQGKTAEHQLGRAQTGERCLSRTLGWRPTCSCGEMVDSGGFDPQGYPIDVFKPHEPIPAIVLDPFAGAGTTPLVALQHRRHFFGIDLSADYCEMAEKRIERVDVRLF